MTTPLHRELRSLVRREGAITVARYMAECLGHPRHGYYMTRDPLGAAGDFVTAPEISQMFGELVGLWVAVVWQGIGSPCRWTLMELGPGRGTLMADALRALRAAPGCLDGIRLHLVETSPVLARQQRERVAPVTRAAWHDSVAGAVESAGDDPLIVVANEFLDALPVHQLVRRRGNWAERLVTCDETGQLAFATDAAPSLHAALVPDTVSRTAKDGDIFEVCPAAVSITGDIARHVRAHGGAALFIDYGHTAPGVGETVQAVRGHSFAPVLDMPGEADLTAHVDFTAVAEAARSRGIAVDGPVMQADFLERLGIAVRAERLAAAAPGRAAEISAGHHRLTAPDGMGTLFKVLGLRHPDQPKLPGF